MRRAAPTRDPRSWGRQFWFVIHTVCAFYPEHPTPTEMSHARAFFLSLQTLLPCPACAVHYAETLRSHPLEGALQSREELARWANHVHNEVNRRLGKPIVAYEAPRASDGPDDATHRFVGAVAVSVALCGAAVVLLRRRAAATGAVR